MRLPRRLSSKLLNPTSQSPLETPPPSVNTMRVIGTNGVIALPLKSIFFQYVDDDDGPQLSLTLSIILSRLRTDTVKTEAIEQRESAQDAENSNSNTDNGDDASSSSSVDSSVDSGAASPGALSSGESESEGASQQHASPLAAEPKSDSMAPLETKASMGDDTGDEAARYSVDLLQSFPEVCQKAKSGVQTCHVVAAFVQEYASMESAYSKMLLRVAQSARANDWAQQLSRSWAVLQDTLEQSATERATFATVMQSTMVSGARAFATQQELQVQRLIAEGTKVRNAQQQMIASLHKAKEKYDRKCADAAEVTSNLRYKADSMDTVSSPPSSFTFESSSGDENARELAEKLTAGAGQLLTKMWDTTSSTFGKSSLERQRTKIDTCLEDVIAAEKHYIQTVDFMNAQRLIYEREIKENLHAFQLTEEQRIEYLKDLLLRQQKAFMKTYENSNELIERLKESVTSIDEIADIQDAFKKLGEIRESEVDEADLLNNTFYRRMIHIQSLSDQGHHMVKVLSNTFFELIAAEDGLLQSLQRLLRIHEHGSLAASTDLFGTSSHPTGNYLVDEGPTMKAGWQVAKDQVQLLLNVHQEFRSLLAEPVALSISTMKQQYENARNVTQENFAKSHASLSSEVSGYTKLQQRFETKARDFSSLLASAQGVASPTDTNALDADQALTLLHQYARSYDKDRKVESKLRHLSDEMRELQQRVAESHASVKQKYNMYIQDIEVFVSVYMKNEKYRLQIKKSSLLGFAKAYEHMLAGGSTVAHRAFSIMENISSTSDVMEFVRSHRKPYQRSKRVVPDYHNNSLLKDALSEYYRSKNGSPASMTLEERKLQRSTITGNAGSPLRRGREKAPAELEMRTIMQSENRPSQDPECSSSPEKSDESGPASAVAQSSETETDVQSLGVSDFQKKFQLDSPEQVVESYSCALYLSNFPYHGRLYLTRDHICFTGWRDTTYVASYLDITMIEKKNTALIVPNAIELTVSGERVFFASFVFRDECFQCLQQLQAIKKGTVALMTASQVGADGTGDATPDPPQVERPEEDQSGKHSPMSLAPVAPKPAISSPLKLVEPAPVTSTASSTAEPTQQPAIIKRVPGKDPMLDEYEIIVDEEVPISVDFAFSTLWVESTAYLQKLLEEGGETNISISAWNKAPTSYTALSTPEIFDGFRRVTFIHNKKYMVGPNAIPTTQDQRYKWDPSTRLIISSTSTVTDAPYCDYFRAENRWVFSTTSKDGVCLVQVGIRIHWIKSTWLKKQIESAAISESKESTRAWLVAAQRASDTSASCLPKDTESSPQKEIASLAPSSPSSKPTCVVQPPKTPVAAAPTPVVTGDAKFALQVASLCCVLLFVYTMLRICSTLEQMQVLTGETLLQQRQQQELFREVMQAFLERERAGLPR
uniref:VASt domain-containing protein n=1 Tax=Globisporangium ultimum (strain ATCC 200006 / CBS 805.95 / DAOM BR144) TaxID=431595 RepID=K3WB97_GLOUD